MEQEDGKAKRFSDGSGAVIGACIEVHRHIGPGLLESAYERCVARELSLRCLQFDRQRRLPVYYKGVDVECGYRIDFVIEDSLILEVKAVECLLPIHEAQLLTYLKLSSVMTGLLVNFREPVLKRGIRRMTLAQPEVSDLERD